MQDLRNVGRRAKGASAALRRDVPYAARFQLRIHMLRFMFHFRRERCPQRSVHKFYKAIDYGTSRTTFRTKASVFLHPDKNSFGAKPAKFRKDFAVNYFIRALSKLQSEIL